MSSSTRVWAVFPAKQDGGSFENVGMLLYVLTLWMVQFHCVRMDFSRVVRRLDFAPTKDCVVLGEYTKILLPLLAFQKLVLQGLGLVGFGFGVGVGDHPSEQLRGHRRLCHLWLDRVEQPEGRRHQDGGLGEVGHVDVLLLLLITLLVVDGLSECVD